MPTNPRKLRLGWGLALLAAALIALATPAALRHLRAIGLLLTVVGAEDPTGLTATVVHDVRERATRVSASGRELRAREYTAVGIAAPRGIVLLHGVHRLGIAEPHLVRFARALAATGASVLTPELPELLDYRVEPTTIDDIDSVARHHAQRTQGPIGAWGISFAGGLALLAAARPGAEARFDHVVAVGAHADLVRLASYYAGEDVRAPDGSPPAIAPHPYGARVIIHAHADDFVAPEAVDAARSVLRLYLSDRQDDARAAATRLDPATRERLETFLDDRRHEEMGRLLMAQVRAHAAELAPVSPQGQLAGLRVPVFLVHGAEDPVIPAIETLHLAREVPSAALRGALVTPVLRHTEAAKPPPAVEYWKIVRFVASILDEASN